MSATIRHRFLTVLLLSAFLVVFAACDSDDPDPNPADRTIAELAQDTPALSTLVAALSEAGLVSTLNGAGPFTVFELEDTTNGRIDTAGSQTSGSFDAGTDTSLTVVTTAERPWINSTDHASMFPFHIRISGVVLNVTAISGSTSPQTFTVTQAPVNGVTKTIASGSAVHIHPIPVLALRGN